MVRVWSSGVVALWPSGVVALWPSGVVALWPSGVVAAEVLSSGVQLNVNELPTIADNAEKLLTDLFLWENVVEAQIAEITQYPSRGFEQALIDLWHATTTHPVA